MRETINKIIEEADNLNKLLNSDWKDQLGKTVKSRLEELISAWNGEDSEFTFEGAIYTEEDVEQATEALAKL